MMSTRQKKTSVKTGTIRQEPVIIDRNQSGVIYFGYKSMFNDYCKFLEKPTN